MGRRAIGGVLLRVEDARDAEASRARGVVRLIVRVRHHEHRPAGSERLSGRADPAVMDGGGRAGNSASCGASSTTIIPAGSCDCDSAGAYLLTRNTARRASNAAALTLSS